MLQLYDPYRAAAPRAGQRRVTLQAVRAALVPTSLTRRVGARGAGLRLLLEPTASPLTAMLLDHVRDRYPDARIFFFAPLESDAPIAASRALLGAPLAPQYDFTKADVVLSLDADFLATGPFYLRHATDFAGRRRQAPAERWKGA